MGERPLFPLVRFLSAPVTRLLAKTPVSANQVTGLSLVVGIAAAWYVRLGDHRWLVVGALLFVGCYILDNCDGEIARLKNQCSSFGMHFDTAVDWIVHSLFFAALGIGHATLTGEEFWKWMGWIAAAGGTINYVLGLIFGVLDNQGTDNDEQQQPESGPEGVLQWFIFIFRELTRADFCFLVLALAAFDVLWVLLPAGAIGAQVYWLLLCVKSARKFHA